MRENALGCVGVVMHMRGTSLQLKCEKFILQKILSATRKIKMENIPRSDEMDTNPGSKQCEYIFIVAD